MKNPNFTQEGILYTCESAAYPNSIDLTAQLLAQLEEEEIASRTNEGILIPWGNLYDLLENTSYSESLFLLSLPQPSRIRPVLGSINSLTDSTFAVTLSGFVDNQGRKIASNFSLAGATINIDKESYLLSKSCWRTIEAIRLFHNRPSNERSSVENQKAWASIRTCALDAGAELSDYLKNTVVLTPDKLKIILRRQPFGESNMIEVAPMFDHAPPGWLAALDKFDQIRERYDIPNGNQLTLIYPSIDTIAVLQEIKKMPGRRVAGNRAEAFIRNPFSLLGPSAEKVINPEQFEKAREDAGILVSRFTVKVDKSSSNSISVSLLIEESQGDQVFTSETPFEEIMTLQAFIKNLTIALRDGAQTVFWEGYDLEIFGDTPDQLLILEDALKSWRYVGVTLNEVLDLTRYSERVATIGFDKAYYSPFIAKKDDEESWFPENVIFGVHYTPNGETNPITLSLNESRLSELKKKCDEAIKTGKEEFIFSGMERSIKINEAREILETIGEASHEVRNGTFNPKKSIDPNGNIKRKTLIIKANIEKVDYSEVRGGLALTEGTPPRIPSSLKLEYKLKNHQESGISWLQHLWNRSPRECRGVVLADDMGLGKTLQLLCLIARCFEEDSKLDPVLIVAPVALLDNWRDEIDKFFNTGTLRVLRLYGDELAERRISKSDLAEELTHAGITRLLRKDWIGNAQIVLTTYETVRDLEFSLATQRWSIMICDEAQKIKNPNAMMTRAAKKQNARFKIACTGTPVENSLADIWCLFDFVQPGLLGALNMFGRTYRRPIEAKTDDEKKKVEELRSIIQPQILRRMKEDVAKDLPRKIMVGFDAHADIEIQRLSGCVNLPMTERQRGLYAGAISHFTGTKEGASRAKNHLGLLQHLRRVCIDPRSFGQLATDLDSVTELEKYSPRLRWLNEALNVIRNRDEKVIIFCEMKDVQRLLQRYIAERFGLTPDFVNGDISVDSKHSGNRKTLIKKFQEKSGFNVILLSPLAAGAGLNIQAANHVIHFSRCWNPAKEDQATDRAHRIDQKKEVFVYCPVVVAKEFVTFDSKLDTLLRYKRELSRDMLNGTGEVSASEFIDIEGINGAPLVEDGPIEARDLDGLNGDALEELCTLLWGKRGFSITYRTPKFPGDGGVDVVAINGRCGELLQCKSSTCDGKELGWEAIKDVASGHAGYSAKHRDVIFKRVAVTNQFFNATAKNQAELNDVQIIERPILEKMITETKIMRRELEKMLLFNSE